MGGVPRAGTLSVWTPMIYGFTGTQDGMTDIQKGMVAAVLSNGFQENDQFHHGDCIGADAEASHIASNLYGDRGYEIHIHPCTIRNKRAFCSGNVIYHAIPPLDRNKVIVRVCDALIAAPKDIETIRSGTWSTVRFARKLNKPIYIVYPDGKVVNENIQ